MKPSSPTIALVQKAAQELATGLGKRAVCIALYGSAVTDDFSPEHSDINLAIILDAVEFADLRLIGAVLARNASPAARFAIPLVLEREFLDRARDVYPIELDDLRANHRLLAGLDVLSPIQVAASRIRDQAERELRGKLLRLRALVIRRPEDAVLRSALARAATSFSVIVRSLSARAAEGSPSRPTQGHTASDAIRRSRRSVLNELRAMRAGAKPWPVAAELDELLRSLLGEISDLLETVDADRG